MDQTIHLYPVMTRKLTGWTKYTWGLHKLLRYQEAMVRFARHVTNEVCGVKCKSAVFYGTELSNPQLSSIREMYRGNILEGISLPQAASRFSSRILQIEKNQQAAFKR